MAFDIYDEHAEVMIMGWFGECPTEKSSSFGVTELRIVE